MMDGDFLALNDASTFSEMDIDTIGEILNISMGAGSTTLSEILGQRVSITTPRVQILHSSKIQLQAFEPAIGVEINYVSGLVGKNIMVLKESDVQVILGLLMHTDQFKENFIMDELAIGAMCEVMNQMMGASSTALSQLLAMPINISPPNSFAIESSESFRDKYFDGEGDAVMITFHLMIGDQIDSEFIYLMAVELGKKLVSAFSFVNSGAEDEKKAAPQPAPVPQPAPAPQPIPAPQSVPVPQPMPAPQPAPQPAPAPQPGPEQYPAYISQPVVQRPVAAQPAYTVSQAAYPSFEEGAPLSDTQNSNLNLILSVPLQVTVEIGQVTKRIKEILEFAPGTIVELDKQAGSQVDIYVNGKAIAKGDVVVVDEFYGVRITEVSSNSEIMKLI